jgi:hypothetical protein
MIPFSHGCSLPSKVKVFPVPVYAKGKKSEQRRLQDVGPSSVEAANFAPVHMQIWCLQCVCVCMCVCAVVCVCVCANVNDGC